MTPQEINERIARAKGWEFFPGDRTRVYKQDGTGYHRLPFWSTDDGLAFKELWPEIVSTGYFSILNGREQKKFVAQYDEFSGDEIRLWSGDTWAETICLAWLALKESQ